MHRYVMLILIAVSCSTREVIQPQPDTMTAASLLAIENKFDDTYPLGATTFVFNKDHTYKIDYASEGRYWHEIGRWHSSGADLQLTATGCDYDEHFEKGYKCSGSFGGGLCKTVKDDISLKFAYKLVCTSTRNKDIGWGRNYLSFSVLASIIPPGTRLKRNGFDIITLGRVDSSVVETVNLRVSPDVQSKRVDYMPYDFYDNPNYPKSVPKGTKIKLLARTVEKLTVKNIANYWYCIEVGALGNVWVFGEYVKQ